MNSRARKRLAAGLAVLLTGLVPSSGQSQGDPQRELDSRRQSASELRAAIAAQSRRIASTQAGLADARIRLADLQSLLEERRAQLDRVRRRMVAARERITRLENLMHAASKALAANLVASYKDPEPDVVSVVLESDGFTDMLERLEFIERIRKQDQRVLEASRRARRTVLAETVRLERLAERYRTLSAEVTRARDQAAAVEGALLTRQAEQLRRRANTSARLDRVRGRIASLRRAIDRLSRPVTTADPSLPVDAGGMAQAPANAPAAVKQVIAAGNAIAGLPYQYGGGHESFRASGYDCSGSISYALAAAGLLSSPLNSTGFMSWGEPGPGRWITVYAHGGHAFMVVAGWRFDTTALHQASTRWTRTMRGTGGFVARHPPGL